LASAADGQVLVDDPGAGDEANLQLFSGTDAVWSGECYS
jgi:hypothetical protein